jgi:UDP-N-acetylglucosamine 1-carboxyvinyltransferase
MKKIKIIGGKPLHGELQIEVNKNAVLPALCATLLTSDNCVMKNVPKSPDVLKILQARWDSSNNVLRRRS